jgi:hypothetical protein
MAHSRVLTIYNCGTAFNRDKATSVTPGTAGELIASLYDKTSDPDINDFGRLDPPTYRYKLIHDGPGSRPGKFGRWEIDAKGTRAFKEYDASASKAAKTGAGPAPLAKALGFGVDANVANALNAVKALYDRPDVINLAGWSRGAVTCHMIANALADDRDLCDVPVNIFAVDPVPGGWFHDDTKLKIQDNVRHYCGVFAVHDRKIAFKPAVVEQRNNVTLYPFPGIHDTLVQGGPGLQAVAVLVEFLAAQFLELHGTKFTRRLHLSWPEVCENYAVAKKTSKQYQQLAGGGGGLNKILGLGGHAPARKQLPSGATGGGLRGAYFVNDHHEMAFKHAFPRVHALVFDARDAHAALTRAGAQGVQDFNAMKTVCRNSHDQLVSILGG